MVRYVTQMREGGGFRGALLAVCLSNRHSRSYDWGGKRLIMDG
jgi:hypothetical protein